MTYKIEEVLRYGDNIELVVSGGEFTAIHLTMPNRPQTTGAIYEALLDLLHRARFFAPPPRWKPEA